RLILSFSVISLVALAYFRWGAAPSLNRYFIPSRGPVVSFTGIVAIVLYRFIRESLPSTCRPLMIALISSIWAVENVQIICGRLVTPVNYEQYWGVVVVGLLATLGILYRAAALHLWVIATVAFFATYCAHTFLFNKAIFDRLKEPQRILPLLATSCTHAWHFPTFLPCKN
ncbi:MAG: hypothetical protein RLZZ486_494, partial [Actinomycetota bacterium]